MAVVFPFAWCAVNFAQGQYFPHILAPGSQRVFALGYKSVYLIRT